MSRSFPLRRKRAVAGEFESIHQINGTKARDREPKKDRTPWYALRAECVSKTALPTIRENEGRMIASKIPRKMRAVRRPAKFLLQYTL